MARFWDWAHTLDPDELRALNDFLLCPGRHRDGYIAFLRARGDARAEIMTIDARLAAGQGAHGRGATPADERAEVQAEEQADEQADEQARARLRTLLDQVDPRWWNTVAQSAEIRACGLGPVDQPVVKFAFECPRTWASLEPSADPHVRQCDRCAEPVYFCTDAAQVAERARRGQCVSVGPELASACRSDATASMTGRPDPNQAWGRRILERRSV